MRTEESRSTAAAIARLVRSAERSSMESPPSGVQPNSGDKLQAVIELAELYPAGRRGPLLYPVLSRLVKPDARK